MKSGKTLIAIALVAFSLFALFTLASLRVTYREIDKELREAREELLNYEEKIAHYESDLSCDMDMNFIERTAREKLGLCYANEIIMEYHLNQ